MGLDHRAVEFPDREIVEEGAAALVLPGAGHRRDRQRRMHLRRAVAAAGETIAEPEEGALGAPDLAGKGLDLRHRHARDRRRPFRRAGRQMRLEFGGAVGIALEIIPIGKTFAEQHMHHAAGERAVGAGPQQDLDVGLLHGVVVVDVDRRDLGAALLAGARGVGHHVDLGVDRVGAPDHHQIGDAHLARIDAGNPAGAGRKPHPRDRRADGGVEAGIFLHMGQTVDAVLHDQPHGAGVIIRPHRLRPELALGLIEPRRHLVQRVVPGNPLESGRSPWARPGAADTSAVPDDGFARRNARPWRRPHPPCRSEVWNP